jgi:hypothetical protein
MSMNFLNLTSLIGFGSSKREEGAKMFMNEELSKINNAGKHSPGPIYNFNEDPIKYKNQPNWGFGTDERKFGANAKYDFYENVGFYDDPVAADHARKPACAAPKIGTEPRVSKFN